MEYFSEEELNLSESKRSLLISCLILVVTLFIDMANLIGKACLTGNFDTYEFIKIISSDLMVAIITFVVTNCIFSSIFRKSGVLIYLVALFTILGFVALIVLKVQDAAVWFVLELIFALLTMFFLSLIYIKIKKYIKVNGRRLPC